MTLKKSDLNYFTGTSQYYFHPMFKAYRYTDGVRHVAKEGGAYWLIEAILSWQLDKAVKAEPFQFWTLKVTESSAVLTATNGNNEEIARQEIEFTDFPLDKISFYLTNNVLLLPSEY